MPAAPDPRPAGRGAIYRDPYGIPHLWADTVDDLAYVQGYEAGYERAWQLEYGRLRAEGRTAALLGPDAVEWDVFARRARIADTARHSYDRLDARTRAWCASYVEGVNDALPLGAADSNEFAALEATPGRWQSWSPLAVFAGIHLVFGTCQYKLWRAHVRATLGPAYVEEFGIEGGAGSSSERASAVADAAAGSNAFAVTGPGSPTGLPIVAGDPHRALEVPNCYQQIRLACPEFDVVGLAFPGVPGVAHFGHAGSVAWATTNAMADYQDLYLERLRTDPAGHDGPQVLGPEGWEPVRDCRLEVIEVRGTPPVEVESIETERGPVVLEPALRQAQGTYGGAAQGTSTLGGSSARGTSGAQPEGDVHGYSLRTPSRVELSLGFDALLPLLHSRSVDDVADAMSRWVEPVNVLVIAEETGRLREQIVGLVPERGAANRLLPVPADDPASAWTGRYLRPDGIDRQVVVNANDRLSGRGLGYDYAPPERARRIRALVEAGAAVGPGLASVSLDTDQPAASTMRALLADLEPSPKVPSPKLPPPKLPPPDLSAAATELRRRLLAWDGRADSDSLDAALFAGWRSAFVRWLLARPDLSALTADTDLPSLFARWVDPVIRLGSAWERLAVAADRLDLDVRAGAVAALEGVAADPPTEPWGRLHRYAPLHPLSGLPGEPEVPAAELSGDAGCVLATRGYPGLDDGCSFGPVARYVWDLADRERSRWVVPMGASGRSSSPHRVDQLALWADGETIPLVTAWQRLRLDRVLSPARPSARPSPSAKPRPAASANRPDPETNR